MDNIEKLKDLGILGDVRQRMGADDESDTSQDERINRLDNHALVGQVAGWELGDSSWWSRYKTIFDELEEMDQLPRGNV